MISNNKSKRQNTTYFWLMQHLFWYTLSLSLLEIDLSKSFFIISFIGAVVDEEMEGFFKLSINNNLSSSTSYKAEPGLGSPWELLEQNANWVFVALELFLREWFCNFCQKINEVSWSADCILEWPLLRPKHTICVGKTWFFQ